MWKTLGGRCIYQTQNGVKVHQNYIYRWLTLGGDALHTLINRRNPEIPGLDYIHQLSLCVRAKPTDCCLLGLGGAGVAHALAPYLGNSQIHAVENNIDVIEMSKKYFMIERIKNLAVINQDAAIFMEECNTKYQHLMVDLYDAKTFPPQCSTQDFFKNCRRVLLPDGFLALNLTNVREQWSLYTNIRNVFCDQTVSLPVKGAANMIVLAYNGASITPLLDLLKNSRSLKKLSWDAQWGCVARV